MSTLNNIHVVEGYTHSMYGSVYDSSYVVRDDVNYYANSDYFCHHPDWDKVEVSGNIYVPSEKDFDF